MASERARPPLVAVSGHAGLSLNSLRALGGAFAAQTAELQTLAALRVDGTTRSLFTDELTSLEATVSALETTLGDIQQAVSREKADMPRAAAVLRRCEAQRDQANHMAENLPPHLQGRAAAAAKQMTRCKDAAQAPVASSGRTEPSQPAGPVAPKGQKRPPAAPRWFVTVQELSSAPGYMKGRVPLDKVNAAVEEIAGHAERVAKAVAGVRAASARTATALGKEAVSLLNSSQKSKAALKGRHWLMESCFKDGSHVKLDKSGRALVTLLRHLGRLQELRVTVAGKQQTILILQAEPSQLATRS